MPKIPYARSVRPRPIGLYIATHTLTNTTLNATCRLQQVDCRDAYRCVCCFVLSAVPIREEKRASVLCPVLCLWSMGWLCPSRPQRPCRYFNHYHGSAISSAFSASTLGLLSVLCRCSPRAVQYLTWCDLHPSGAYDLLSWRLSLCPCLFLAAQRKAEHWMSSAVCTEGKYVIFAEAWPSHMSPAHFCQLMRQTLTFAVAMQWAMLLCC